MSIIAGYEVIVPDQLTTSSQPGKVRVHYPRGESTILACNFDQDPPLLYIDDGGADGAYQWWSITSDGNVLNTPDKPTRPATMVPGKLV